MLPISYTLTQYARGTLILEVPRHETFKELVRPAFDEELSNRDAAYAKELVAFLDDEKLILGGVTAQCRGDWHTGRCTVLLRTESDSLVLKNRRSDVEAALGAIVDAAAKKLQVLLFVPGMRTISLGQIQTFVASEGSFVGLERELGLLIAIVIIWRVRDLHRENVQPVGQSLAILDGECSFHFDASTTAGFLENSGLFYINEKDHRDSLFGSAKNAIKLRPLLDSFECAFPLMLKAFNQWRHDPSLPRRYVVANSEYYMRLLRRRYWLGSNEADFTSEVMSLATKRGCSPVIANAELTSLLAWNVPMFYLLDGYLVSSSDITHPLHFFGDESSSIEKLRSEWTGVRCTDLAAKIAVLVRQQNSVVI